MQEEQADWEDEQRIQKDIELERQREAGQWGMLSRDQEPSEAPSEEKVDKDDKIKQLQSLVQQLLEEQVELKKRVATLSPV